MSIYLDNAATTPLMPEAAQAMKRYYSADFYNPSALYSKSRHVRDKIEEARSVIAGLIGAEPEEIFFTSGGTESDNWALNEAMSVRGHIIAGSIEHKAVLAPLERYAGTGGRYDLLPVDGEGFIKPEILRKYIKRDTSMISVMTANNEISTVEPIGKLARIAHEYDIIFHTDAVQAFGHIPVNVDSMNVDMLSASSHKFNGPKGTGFLYIRRECRAHPFIYGGGQEKGMRSGTENVPGIIGMAEAARVSCARLEMTMAHCRRMSEYITGRIMKEIENARVNGPSDYEKRLPGNMSIGFENVDAQSLLVLLDMYGVNAAAGSACGKGNTSHVLRAVRTPDKYAMGTIRMSIDKEMNYRTADYVVEVLKKSVAAARKQG